MLEEGMEDEERGLMTSFKNIKIEILQENFLKKV